MPGGPCSEHNSPRVYIAAPIFSKEQLEAVGVVVDEVHAAGYVSYSPARDGVMLAPTDPAAKRDEVYHSNLRAIRQSDLLIAILDVKDTGTIWELGAAAGFGIPIVAVTMAVSKMNVMLERGVIAHVLNPHDLALVLRALRSHLEYGLKRTMGENAAYEQVLYEFNEHFSYSGETQ